MARHCRLSEVARRRAEAYPAKAAHLTAFEPGDAHDLPSWALLRLSPEDCRDLAAVARRVAEDNWNWSGVASRLLKPMGVE